MILLAGTPNEFIIPVADRVPSKIVDPGKASTQPRSLLIQPIPYRRRWWPAADRLTLTFPLARHWAGATYTSGTLPRRTTTLRLHETQTDPMKDLAQ